MPALSVQEILDRNCCPRYSRASLEAIWDGQQHLSAAQMLNKVQVPLGDRVWAIMQAEPSVDWLSVATQLYAMLDVSRYPVAEGAADLAGKFGPDAYTAAFHVEAYAAVIGNSSLVVQATNLIREVLP